MEKIVIPTVTVLVTGEHFVVKQMLYLCEYIRINKHFPHLISATTLSTLYRIYKNRIG